MEKGEVIPCSAVPKSDILLSSNYCLTLSTNSGIELERHEKLKLADGFRHSLLEWSFPRNKVKLNESRLLKFYQVKRLKENLTENSAEKNFKEDSQFNELWNISTKQKKTVKKNTQIQRTLKHFYKTKKEKKNTQIQRTLKHFYKTKKRKEKYSNSKNFVSPDTLSDKVQQMVLKICNTLSFLSLSFLFLLYKIPF